MDGDLGNLFSMFNPERLLFALIVIAAGVFITRVVNSTLDRIGERQARYRLTMKKLGSITRFVVFIVISVLVVTNVFTLNREALLALGGTIAVTVGFALKDTAASIISGILILVDQPFQVGDWITFGGVYGEVKEIGLRSVRVVTPDDNLVSIPTNKFLTEVVASGNAGELDMQVTMDFYIATDADFQRAKRIAYEAAVTSKYVFLNKPVRARVTDQVIGNTFVTRIRIRAYVMDARFERRFLSEVTERVKASFRDEQIEPPYSTQRHVRLESITAGPL